MKILIVSPISEHAVNALGKKHDVVCAFNAPQEEIKRLIVGCDVLVFRSGPDINADIMRCSSRLSLLIRAGSGLDNLDLNYVKNKNITLRRIEAPGARAVAELSFALMLALARQLSHPQPLPRRLLIHPRLGGRDGQRLFDVPQLHQSPHLPVFDHHSMVNFALTKPGILIVVGQDF